MYLHCCLDLNEAVNHEEAGAKARGSWPNEPLFFAIGAVQGLGEMVVADELYHAVSTINACFNPW